MPRQSAVRTYDAITRLLPPKVAAGLDLRLRPSMRNSWGGPMNGQAGRRAIVRELARTIAFDRVLETGTYRGTTTEFLSAVIGTPVHTVEIDARFREYSAKRLSFDRSIKVVGGDSRAFLRAMAARSRLREQTLFVYLDAHWRDDLPLREELEIVRDSFERAVVMVDDFQVPGDDGYGFDDYGPGKRLGRELLPPLPGWAEFYPALPSGRESGFKRGCVVLAAAALAKEVGTMTTLRPATSESRR